MPFFSHFNRNKIIIACRFYVINATIIGKLLKKTYLSEKELFQKIVQGDEHRRRLATRKVFSESHATLINKHTRSGSCTGIVNLFVKFNTQRINFEHRYTMVPYSLTFECVILLEWTQVTGNMTSGF